MERNAQRYQQDNPVLQHGRAACLAHIHITPIQMQHPHRVAARRDCSRKRDDPRVADGIVPEVEGFQLPNIQSKVSRSGTEWENSPEFLSRISDLAPWLLDHRRELARTCRSSKLLNQGQRVVVAVGTNEM